ncbi:hypothetical protein MKD49_05410 [Herbaspirillum sp. WGmk3]|uniref:hypothetical protein n=1 Tax=Herbaspirillum sp. WGmk3 TaxID=2919925 RepID=UPI0020903C5C|nr:hypothetical protein [Herbaspirillum sp. WGmk3]MCO4855919.1 hypothetical protein [Herbaspirillum sp. WGmk3]
MTNLSAATTVDQSPSVRLERLLNFLSNDPSNMTLRGEVFDTALQEGNLVLADKQLAVAKQAGDHAEWQMREANLAIAQSRLDEAEGILQKLEQIYGQHPAISQNLGFIAGLRSDHHACQTLISQWADVEATADVPAGLQSMWLRCLHHLGELERAMVWALKREEAGTLAAEAMGVASLIAIDSEQIPSAKRWAENALATLPRLHEAQLSYATVALGDRDSNTAQQTARDILSRTPGSGRAWSILGLAQMLAFDLPAARVSLQKSVEFMPSHIGTWHGLAWSCFLAKDYVAAQGAFEEALARSHNFSETHGGLAVLAAVNKQRAAAEEHLRRAFGLDPQCMTAQYARAILDGTLKDEQSVHALARKMMQQSGAT